MTILYRPDGSRIDCDACEMRTEGREIVIDFVAAGQIVRSVRLTPAETLATVRGYLDCLTGPTLATENPADMRAITDIACALIEAETALREQP
jgi:hypothetical protein